MKHITVFSLPYAVKNNQYLEILYTGVTALNSEDTHDFKIQRFSFPKLITNVFLGRPTIVHVHWETHLYGSKYYLYSLFKIVTRFPLLYVAQVFGIRIVWTMHNLHAHDYPFPTLDTFGRFCIRSLADGIIIQNKEYATEFSKRYPKKKVVCIPHPNYVGVYGVLLEKHTDANAGITLLALGAIRPYKHLEVLIDTVRDLSNVTLLIAGKGEQEYVAKLKAYAGDSDAIQIHAEYVPDEKIPDFFAGADYAVFSYGDSSLTSGALLLALSYGTPVITMPMPAAESILEGINGYVVADETALKELLTRLPGLPIPDPHTVLATVETYTPEYVAKQTRELYVSVYTGTTL